jgi:hypothetical protein
VRLRDKVVQHAAHRAQLFVDQRPELMNNRAIADRGGARGVDDRGQIGEKAIKELIAGG